MAILPPKEVFEIPPMKVRDRLALSGYDLPNFLEVTQGPGGEMLSHYYGHAVPRKGLSYLEAISAVNLVKRITLSMFVPFSGVKRGFVGFLDNYLMNYARLAESV